MKRSLSLVMILAAFALAACSGTSDGPRAIRAGRGSGAGGAATSSGGIPGALGTTSGPNITTPSSGSSLGWGVITPTDNNTVKNFLSTNFTASQIGNTVAPCQVGAGFGSVSCIIEFTITKAASPTFNPVSLQPGLSLAQAMNSTTPDYAGDGFLTIAVWDSLSGTTDPTGTFPQGLPPIPVVIPLSTQTGNYNSYVQSYGASFVAAANAVPGYASPINLIFGDNEGAVAVVGTVVGSQFSGTVQFMNTVSVSGSPQSGNLGSFQINICSILSPCQ